MLKLYSLYIQSAFFDLLSYIWVCNAQHELGTQTGIKEVAKMNTYGVEIESIGLTENELKVAIESVEGLTYAGHFGYHGLQSRFGTRGKHNGLQNLWGSERDGSLVNNSGRGMSHEVVSPIMYGNEGLKVVSRVMKAMTRAGAKVNKSCGTHITTCLKNSARFKRMSAKRQAHTLNKMIEAYTYFYAEGFCAVVSQSRREFSPTRSGYGGFNLFKELERGYDRGYMNFAVGDVDNAQYDLNRKPMRRDAININKFATSGLIEFRQHQGTLNGEKITAWAKLLTGLFHFALNENHPNYGKDLREFPPTFEGMLECLNIKVQTARVLRERKAHFEGGFMPTNQYMTNAYNTYQMERELNA